MKSNHSSPLLRVYLISSRLKSPTSSFANTTYSPNSTFSPHQTQNTTNISSHISHLNQSIGSPYNYGPNYSQNTTQNASHLNQNSSHLTQNTSHVTQNTNHLTQNSSNLSQNLPTSPHTPTLTPQPDRNGSYSQNSFRSEDKQYTVQSPTFSSFRPQEEPKQNYEGFTTR